MYSGMVKSHRFESWSLCLHWRQSVRALFRYFSATLSGNSIVVTRKSQCWQCLLRRLYFSSVSRELTTFKNFSPQLGQRSMRLSLAALIRSGSVLITAFLRWTLPAHLVEQNVLVRPRFRFALCSQAVRLNFLPQHSHVSSTSFLLPHGFCNDWELFLEDCFALVGNTLVFKLSTVCWT